jgi:hypothetical protein
MAFVSETSRTVELHVCLLPYLKLILKDRTIHEKETVKCPVGGAIEISRFAYVYV